MDLFTVLLKPLFSLVFNVFCLVAFCVLVALLFVFFRLWSMVGHCPLTASPAKLRSSNPKGKLFDFLRWVLVDFKEEGLHKNEFREHGFTFYVGRQGSGKTTAMVEQLERYRLRYPDCIIVTNFKYSGADFIMHDWSDLLNVRNGEYGVVFAIDEIHSEYSSADWKDVPDNLLSEISQQRKQRVKILATCQYFGRVAKPLREQSQNVVVCTCFGGRFIRTLSYDSVAYTAFIDSISSLSKKLRPLSRYSFVSGDGLRGKFDTYEKIERMRRIDSRNRRMNGSVKK